MKRIINIGFILMFFGGINAATAASLYFSPSSGNYYNGENFTVGVFVNADVAINAISGVLTFPTDYLEITRINKNNSIVNLWVQEPSFSNTSDFGNASFEGVILNPGFTGSKGKILDIVFRVKNKGSADLSFIKAAILANDGLGTNIANPNGGANFTLLIKPASKVEQKPEAIAPSPTIIIKEIIRETKPITGVLAFWEILPNWIKISILALIGITAFILGLIALSFGIIILVFIWSHFWNRRKKIARKIFKFGETMEKEIAGDVKYTVHQLEKDIKEAESDASFKDLIKDHLILIRKIIKRFLTRNVK